MLFPECLIQKGRLFQFWYFGSMIIIYMLLPYLMKLTHSPKLWLILLGGALFCSIVFALNIYHGFEKHTIQTFRLWNWFFYFLLGAYIHQNESNLRWIKWYLILPSLVIYTLFFKMVKVGGNEFYFCSLLCMIHSSIVFISILNLKISGSKVITQMSNLFLPVYTFHMFIEVYICSKTPIFRLLEQSFQTSIAFIIEYSIAVLACIIFSLCLMKIPFMDKVFKI